MTEQDYARDGWFALTPERFSETLIGETVGRGLIRYLPHGVGYFRITGRGLRVLTRRRFKVNVLEQGLVDLLTELKDKTDARAADHMRAREAKKIQARLAEMEDRAKSEPM